MKNFLFIIITLSLLVTPASVSAQIPAMPGVPVDPVFNPNFIISDNDMLNPNAMALTEVQEFLAAKPGILAGYKIFKPQIAMEQTAAEIIFQAAQTNGISPKVLLVLLQKEQSLVEDPTPTQYAFDWATGYAVCDGCSLNDPNVLKFKGFQTQVEKAAGALSYYMETTKNWLKQAGIIYNIDSIPVIPANRATAGLYTYTPHFRGNYNFWKIWQRWFSQKYPDGLVVQVKDDDTIYLIQNGQLLPFKNRAILYSRYNKKNIILVDKSELESYKVGPEIKFINFSLVKTEKGKIYLLANDQKRLVDKNAFRYYGFGNEEVIKAKEADLAAYTDGPPVPTKAKYPLGALMQDAKTKNYYLVTDSIKHPIFDKNVITVNFPSRQLKKVTTAALAKFKEGEPIIFQDGTLVKTKDSPEIYLISNNLRRLIADETTFEALGLEKENIIITNEKTLSLHPLGEPISLTAPQINTLTQANP